MRYILSIIVLTFFLIQAKSQTQHKLDSLERLLEETTDEPLKLKLMGDLCWGYGAVNFDKALFYGQAALTLAEQLKDSVAIALSYSDIGNTYTRANHLQEALNFHLKSYALREELGLKVLAAGSVSNIAVIYKQQGRYKEALDYMHRALKIYEESGNEPRQALVLVNIGNVYLAYQKYQPAKESFERAIRLVQKPQTASTLANAYSGLMKYYFHQKKYPEALKHALIAEKYLIGLNMKSDLAAVHNNIGQVYYEQGKPELAMKYYQRALSSRLFMKDKLGIASCYRNIAAVYTMQKNYPLAEKYLNQSIDLFKEIDARDYLREAYSLMSTVFERKEDEKNALRFLKASVLIKDSIYNKQASDKITELQIAYQTEKKTQQINLLNKENKIQKLTLFKRNVLLGITVSILCFGLLITYMLFKSARLKQATRLQEEVMKQQDLATKSILNAEENERKRISAELHDGVGQMFSVVKMNLSALLYDITFKNEKRKIAFDNTLALVDESCKEVRAISHQMAPNVLLKSGLSTAIKDFINKIDTEKLKINLEIVGLNQKISQDVETVLYRVIQESVNNVIKHAEASTLDIQLIREESNINVMIEDNGKGFDISELEKFEGIGLKNIKSRVSYLKGQVDFSTQPGSGTLIAIYIPL